MFEKPKNHLIEGLTSGTVKRKESCPSCRSKGWDNTGDNLVIYTDNSAYCFRCKYVVPSEEYKKKYGYDTYEECSEELTEGDILKLKEKTSDKGGGFRGIKDSIYKYFGVLHEYSEETGELIKQYYPITKESEHVGYKARIVVPKKDFYVVGTNGWECDLFPQKRFQSGGKNCVIVGGEIDQLSAYQMLAENLKRLNPELPVTSYPAVVTPTTGETSSIRQLQKHYDFFNKFERIVLCFDNDEAGREATEKAVKVLPRGKVYIMNLSLKDPNEYLQQNREREFVKAFYEAKIYTPAGVYASTELYGAALENLDQRMLSLPPFMNKAAEMLGGGLVANEITLILARTSIGKTTLMSALTEHWVINEPAFTLGVLSLEATKAKYSRNLLSYYLKVPLHRIKDGQERREYLEQPHIAEKTNKLYIRPDGTPSFYLCDDRGASVEQVKEKILEMIIRTGVNVLLIDPYSDLLSGLSISEQEDLATWIKKVMKEYDITPIIVSHVRKSANNSKNNDNHITEDDAQGSSFLVKAAGQTLSLERDKQAEDPIQRNRTMITILKNRDFSETGPAGSIYYDIETANLYDYDEWIEEHGGTEEF